MKISLRVANYIPYKKCILEFSYFENWQNNIIL